MPKSQIEQVLVCAINQTLCEKDDFLAALQKNIESVPQDEKSQPIADIDKRLAELQDELLKWTGARADFQVDLLFEAWRQIPYQKAATPSFLLPLF